MPFPCFSPHRARLVGVALLLAAATLSGCSHSGPSAPQLPPPTRFMVFSSDRGRAAGVLRSYYLSMDGATYAQFPASDTIIARRPSVRSDGSQIAFEEDPAPGYAFDKRVVLYRTANGARTLDAHVNLPGTDTTDPYLSLDGTRLLFVRDTLGTKQLRLYDLTQHLLVPLPGLAGAPGTNDRAPACDAQAHRIAFVSDRNGDDDVFIYQVPTASLIDIPGVAAPGEDQDPSLSGNGRFLAWASNRSSGAGGFDIMLADVDALTLMPFTGNTSSNDMEPSLSFDGTNMVLVSDRPNGSGGLDLWNFNLIVSTATQVNNESSAGSDLTPVLVWP